MFSVMHFLCFFFSPGRRKQPGCLETMRTWWMGCVSGLLFMWSIFCISHHSLCMTENQSRAPQRLLIIFKAYIIFNTFHWELFLLSGVADVQCWKMLRGLFFNFVVWGRGQDRAHWRGFVELMLSGRKTWSWQTRCFVSPGDMGSLSVHVPSAWRLENYHVRQKVRSSALFRSREHLWKSHLTRHVMNAIAYWNWRV